MPTIGGSASPQPTGYAPGGTPGQYLARSGTADSTWNGVLVGGDRPYVSGQWYNTAYAYSATANTVSLSANYTYYSPCYFASPITIAKMGIYAATCGTGLQFNFGIWYHSSSTQKPAGWAWGGSAIAGTAPCQIIATVSPSLALSAGWWWFGASCTAGWSQTSDSGSVFRLPYGTNFDSMATAAQNANAYYTGLQYNASSVLNSDPVTTLATAAQYSAQCPAFYFQVA